MSINKTEVTAIRCNRAVYTIEGTVDASLMKRKKDLYFYDYDQKRQFKPTILTWESDEKFSLVLNVESANDENPLLTGNYYLAFTGKKGDIKEFLLSKEVRKNRAEEEWNSEVRIVKSKGHKIICSSGRDLDTDGFYIGVTTALPKPRKNFLRKKVGEWFYGIAADFKDHAEHLFVLVFKIFNKLAKKKGNKILFTSGSRAVIGGNEEFVYKRMIERGLDKQYKFVFDFKESINKRHSPFKMIRFIYRLASSDVIILDDYFPEIYKPDYDENVKIIQVWHACGAFKSLGLERMDKAGAPPINTRVHKCYTHVPVSSEHSARHHQEAFGIDYDKFYPVGIPRTDIFFDEEYKKNMVAKLHEAFPRVKEAKRVIMYAPTFRGDSAVNARFPMEKFDLNEWGALCKRTDSYLIVKMHPFVQEKISIPEEYADYIMDASGYREVNDLLFITDVLVTDYSSIIYEFSLLRRPMLFYAFDQSMYELTRDFYEPYEDIIPGRVIKRFDQLLLALEKEEYDTDRLEWFINKNFTYTDGKATDRVVDLIIGKE
jgi:CDP-ribitol ribitolphosphotransferase